MADFFFPFRGALVGIIPSGYLCQTGFDGAPSNWFYERATDKCNFRRRSSAALSVSSFLQNVKRMMSLPAAGLLKKMLPGTVATPISVTRNLENSTSFG